MTLVVAYRISRGIRLIGDSKITDRDAILRGQLTGALKIIILDTRALIVNPRSADLDAAGVVRLELADTIAHHATAVSHAAITKAR